MNIILLIHTIIQGLNSLIAHTSKRHLFLLNDAFLIAKNTSAVLSINPTYVIHQAFSLTKLSFQDLITNTEDTKSFELITPKRSYIFITDSEAEKRIWLEELELAIYAAHLSSPSPLLPGWQHRVVMGTIYSDALLGNMNGINFHLSKLNGGSPDILDSSGMSALHWAALSGHTNIVERIVDSGGDVNILNSSLNSPLHIAASQGHSTTVQSLIDRNADLSSRNLKDRDPLFMAVLYCRREKFLENVLKILFVKGVDINQFDSSGSAPLHECAIRGLAMPIKYLVDEDADINLKHNSNGLTPLQIACSAKSPNAECIRAILENGALINLVDSKGKTPFENIIERYTVIKKLDLIYNIYF